MSIDNLNSSSNIQDHIVIINQSITIDRYRLNFQDMESLIQICRAQELSEINLLNCAFDSTDAFDLLMSFLLENTHVKALSLEKSELEIEYVESLADVLSDERCQMTYLSLANTLLEDTASRLIMEALPHNSSLTTLNLSQNDFSRGVLVNFINISANMARPFTLFLHNCYELELFHENHALHEDSRLVFEGFAINTFENDNVWSFTRGNVTIVTSSADETTEILEASSSETDLDQYSDIDSDDDSHREDHMDTLGYFSIVDFFDYNINNIFHQ